MGERTGWQRAWDVFLDVGVNLWFVWLMLFVFGVIAVDKIR